MLFLDSSTSTLSILPSPSFKASSSLVWTITVAYEPIILFQRFPPQIHISLSPKRAVEILVWPLILICSKPLNPCPLQGWAWALHQQVPSYVSTSFPIPVLPWTLGLSNPELLASCSSPKQTMLLHVSLPLLMLSPLLESSQPLSSPLPLPARHQYRLSSGINYMDLQVWEPSVPFLVVTVFCPYHILLRWSVHVPISPKTLISSKTRTMPYLYLHFCCLPQNLAQNRHLANVWLNWAGDLGRGHSRDWACDLSFTNISAKQWSLPPKDWQKLTILSMRVKRSWDQHSPVWVTHIGLGIKEASVPDSMI